MTTNDVRRIAGIRLLRDGVVTLVAVALVFAAFDDITTGNESDFFAEYAVVAVCAVTVLLVSVRLVLNGYRVLGGVSLLILGAATWAQRAIGPGITPGLWAEYVVTGGALLWFAALSVILVGVGWHIHPGPKVEV